MNQKKPTAPGPAWVPTTEPRFETRSICGLRAQVAHHRHERLRLRRRVGVRDGHVQLGHVLAPLRERRDELLHRLVVAAHPLDRDDLAVARSERIGFTFRSCPAQACARPMRPPLARYSSVSTVKISRALVAEAVDQRLDLLVGRPRARAAAGSRARASPPRPRPSRCRRRAPCRRRASPRRCGRSRPCPRACPRDGASRCARSPRAPRSRRGSRPASAARSSAAPAAVRSFA